MKKIYLIRHGETEWNALSKIQGHKDIPLTDKGIEQAKLTGNRLINENINAIYCSDLERAYNTAKIIGDKVSAEPNQYREFREINFGIWEGLSNDKLDLKYKNEIGLWRTEPEKIKIEGGESLEEVQTRAINCLNNIIKEEPGENLLIVSHGVTIKTIILGILDMNLSYFKNFTIENAGLTIIEFRDYNKVLKVLNDTSHLKEIV